MPTVRTRAFKSGNSVAVRLPKAFSIQPGQELTLQQYGKRVTIEPTEDETAKLTEWQAWLKDWFSQPPLPPQPREGIHFPDREQD